MVITFKISCLNNFQVYDTVLLIIVTMLYIRCPDTINCFFLPPPQLSSPSKTWLWLNVSAYSTPPPIPAPKQLNVAEEKHMIILTRLTLNLWHHISCGLIGLPGSPTSFSPRIHSHTLQDDYFTHFPVASNHQHFSSPFQFFIWLSKEIW